MWPAINLILYILHKFYNFYYTLHKIVPKLYTVKEFDGFACLVQVKHYVPLSPSLTPILLPQYYFPNTTFETVAVTPNPQVGVLLVHHCKPVLLGVLALMP